MSRRLDDPDAILWVRTRRPFDDLWRVRAPKLQGTSRADPTPSQRGQTMIKSSNHLDALKDIYSRKAEQENHGLPFAFVAVTGSAATGGGALGVAEANARGYSPIPDGWASGTFAEMQQLADELNQSLGIDALRAAEIVCSTMGGRKVYPADA